MKLGAQLYTLRDYLQNERDVARTLARVAKIGYKSIQASGLGKIDPVELRKICDNEGLEIVITHSDVNRILFDTDKLIEEHNTLGCKYIGLGGMPERYRNGWWFEQFVEDFSEPTKKMQAAGKKFMYHNHSFEFQKITNNDKRLLIDHIMDAFTPDMLGFTLDTYWVQAAGGDVCFWLEKLQDRIPCVHLKDMAVSGITSKMAPVGEGNMNFNAILKTLKELGKTEHILVEQDICEGSPFLCLETSFKNVSDILATL